MKLLGIIIFGVLLLVCVTVFAQKYERKGNEFIEIKDKPVKAQPIKTDKVWVEEGTKIKYPIYISSTGSCFIIKTSKRTGKEYRAYLGTEISKEICDEKGIKYTPKVRTN